MLRTAIVGIGTFGKMLVTSVQGKSDDITFVTGQTRSPAKAAEFCREHKIKLVDSYDAILADKSIDAVVLATPHSQHADQVKKAAAAGKHIFVEKPFTLTRATAEDALAAVDKAAITFTVGFNRRFHPSMNELRRRIRGGELGPIQTCIGEHTAYAGLYTPADGWRASPSESPAGAMTGIGIHTVDIMIDLIGKISEVHCVSARRAAPHIDDSTSVFMKFENGATGMFYAALATAPNYRLAVYGSKGLAEVLKPTHEDFRFMATPDKPGPQVAILPAETIHTPNFSTLNAELVAFARAAAKGTKYPIARDEILHGVSVFEAIVKSAETGRPVTVG